jgi:hypothetical protein
MDRGSSRTARRAGVCTTEAEVRRKVTALALRVIADRVEHGEQVPLDLGYLFDAA